MQFSTKDYNYTYYSMAPEVENIIEETHVEVIEEILEYEPEVSTAGYDYLDLMTLAKEDVCEHIETTNYVRFIVLPALTQ